MAGIGSPATQLANAEFALEIADSHPGNANSHPGNAENHPIFAEFPLKIVVIPLTFDEILPTNAVCHGKIGVRPLINAVYEGKNAVRQSKNRDFWQKASKNV